MNRQLKTLAFFLLVAGAVILAFWPSLWNGWTSWDDQTAIVNNPQIRSLAPANLLAIFTSFHYGLYHPLVTLSQAIEYHYFRLVPLAYHATNLGLHVLNSGLVLAVGLALGVGQPAALAIALLFGLHPAHVESVAWAMERKDMLFAFFFLAALWSYLYYLKRGDRRGYFLALGLFFLALLSKITAISFPLVMLLCDQYFQKKSDLAGRLEKVPAFVLAGIFGVVAVLARHFTGGLTNDPAFSVNNIFIGSYRAIFYYLARIVFPFNEMALYPGASFNLKSFGWLPPLYLWSPLLLLVGLIWFFRSARGNRLLSFGGAFFALTLLPGLFVISVGPFADRFTYLPSLGILLAGAAILAGFRVQFNDANWLKVTLVGGVIILLGALGGQTWQSCGRWRDSLSLWDAACTKYPCSIEALTMRGFAYAERGDLEQVRRDLLRAQQLAPDNAGIRLNLKNLAEVTAQRERALLILNRKKNSARMKP